MATGDKSGKKAKDGKPEEKKAKRARAPGATGAEHQAERLARSLGESAQHVWLAGIGALGRAQSEGSKLFASLVEEGEQLERRARKSAGDRAVETMEAVGNGVDEVRGIAEGTWERWEKGFDDRMQRALSRLGVPSRQDVSALERQVEALRADLRRERAAKAVRKTAAKSAAGSATRKAAAARKSAVAKGVAKPASPSSDADTTATPRPGSGPGANG